MCLLDIITHSLPELNDGRAFVSQAAAVSGGAVVGVVAAVGQTKKLGALGSVPRVATGGPR